MWKHPNLLEKVVSKIANIRGRTPLHQAAQQGHKRTVEVLLEEGAGINATDKDGAWALNL